MSKTTILPIEVALLHLSGRELLVLAFPDYEGFIRTLAGLSAGIFAQFSNLDHGYALLGLGIYACMDLLVTQNLAWTVIPAMGWLIATIGFEVESAGRSSHPNRRVKRPGHPLKRETLDFPSPAHPIPGTSVYARFHELPPSSNISIAELPTSPILPLTSENIKRLVLTSESLDIDSETISDDFETAMSLTPRVHWHVSSPTDTPHTINSRLPEGGTEVSPPQVGLVGPEDPGSVNGDTVIEDVDATGTSPVFRDLPIDRGEGSSFLSPVELQEETTSGLQLEFEQAADPTEAAVFQEDDIHSEGFVSETASLLSTVRSVELTGTCKELLHRAEAHRRMGNRAVSKMKALETQREQALIQGDSGRAFDLKFAIREAQEETQRANRKAARMYYKVRNLHRPPASRMIDVHYLQKEEALQMSEKALREVQLQGGQVLRVIVGKGIHSRGRQPILKPYIQNQLQEQGMQVVEDRFNSGVLIITLT